MVSLSSVAMSKITVFILRHLTFDFSESPYQTLNITLNIIIYS